MRVSCVFGGSRAEAGQMAVELAVLMPVVLVVALTLFNLGRYVALCASFDQIAPDAVLSQGVSPAGAQTQGGAIRQVEDAIGEALAAQDSCSVEVTAERVGVSGGTGNLTLSPFLTRFTCVLSYRPWPSTFVVGGVGYEVPVALTHEVSLVVDRYRPGVVM